MTNPNDTAFPDVQDSVQATSGLTKREYFAAMAMPAILESLGIPNLPNATYAAGMAVKAADELIKALNNKP